MEKDFDFKPVDDLIGQEIYLRLKMLLPADEDLEYVPTYVFRICSIKNNEFLGEISLRVGFNQSIYYAGHIGYNVSPPHRGHNY
ncbi:MAG: tagatose-bisphosphate aldolase, partial [Clostridiales bacterium]|nr:tagatose-bisphosphate aldolase [Clostridiales bacterium]